MEAVLKYAEEGQRGFDRDNNDAVDFVQEKVRVLEGGGEEWRWEGS